MGVSVVFLAVVGLRLALCRGQGEQRDHPLLFEAEGGLELSTAALNVKTSFEPYDDTWQSFKSAFGRGYKNKEEEIYRRQVFMDNIKTMEIHNINFHKGQTTYWMAINQFSDMTEEEFKAYSRLAKDNSTASESESSPFLPPLNYQAPASVDWRSKGYVTPVKNQGQCGSCWSFSTTGVLEGQYYRKTGRLVSLSEQQLVDCSKAYGNNGCNGGLEWRAYNYIKAARGINSESVYPYEAQDGPCRYQPTSAVTSVSGYKSVARGSESALEMAVASQGPISVNIDASHPSFQKYGGGVYYEASCSNVRLDHAVLAVGYGTSGGSDYWIVKNSWGTQWGTGGYIYMARNKNNNCGIASDATFPVI